MTERDRHGESLPYVPAGVDPAGREQLPVSGEDTAALEALAASGLLADSQMVGEVISQPDPLAAVAEESKLEARVAEIFAEINDRAPEHDVQPATDRVVACLDILGNPQQAMRIIQLTGTNGKTSTARMIAALLAEKGLRVGRFTSPHMHTVRERFAIDGEPISRAAFIDIYEQILPAIEMVDAKSQEAGGPRMSTFEVYAVIAYAAFADAPVEVAVMEVGMGGRWDATNVVDSEVAVLTTIEVDHERYLGSSREEIASEKVGIISPRSTVVCAAQHADAAAVIASAIAENSARLLLEGRDLRLLDGKVGLGGQMISVSTPAATYEDIPLSLLGSFQARNALLAIGAVEAFFGGGALDPLVVEHALMAVNSPGRLDVVRTSPTVIVDGGHNPAGVDTAIRAIREIFPGPIACVFAAMADKKIEDMLGALEPHVSNIVVTQMRHPRAADIDELRQLAEEVFGEDRVSEEYDLTDALDMAASLADAEADGPAAPVVLAIGSIELAARVREMARRV